MLLTRLPIKIYRYEGIRICGKNNNNDDDDVNDEKKMMDGHFLLIGLDTYM